MKLKKNQSGFTFVEILIVLAIIGLTATVSWFALSRQKTASDKSSDQQISKTKDKSSNAQNANSANTEKYENKELQFSFEYPKGWKIIPISDAPRLTLRVESPDHASQEGGYGGTTAGATIFVLAGNISDTTIAHKTIDSILDGTAASKSSFTEQKEVKVNGLRGVQYKSQYEGPTLLGTQFDTASRTYSLTLEEDVDGPSFNTYLAEYQAIINSFRVNN